VSFNGNDIVIEGPRLSTLSVGPVEEKFVYHFRPGTSVLTAGFYNCNLRCSFCINHEISQAQAEKPFVDSAELVSRAVVEGASGLAFSFSEPLLYAEYVRTAFEMAHVNGLYTILKTSGMMSKELFDLVLEETDACCVDIKGDPETYLISCGATPKDVDLLFDNIESAKSLTNLELSLIVRPGRNKLESVLMDLSGAVGPLVPIHLVSFIPSFKEISSPATLLSDMAEARSLAQVYFDHVYDENPVSETICRVCMKRLIRRDGGVLTYNVLEGNSCHCGEPLWKDKCATITNAQNARLSLK